MRRYAMIMAVLAGVGHLYAAGLEKEFRDPPDSARPGVYWYFMGGNLDRDEMIKDLDSMKAVGLGRALFLEVNDGLPAGPINFMSEPWQDMVANAFKHAEQIGLDISVGTGPGWAGSGGPWIPDDKAMQDLVFSETDVDGPKDFKEALPVPRQNIHCAYEHIGGSRFYEDQLIFAIPRRPALIGDIIRKALYQRYPFSSRRQWARAYLPADAEYAKLGPDEKLDPDEIIDLSAFFDREKGVLNWKVPAGDWTIVRMGRSPNGAKSRPAPGPGLGFENNKFDKAAYDIQFENYTLKLLSKCGPRKGEHGWNMLHLDSWEMGSQNWTPAFIEEFKKRRGYDPTPFLLTYTGRAVKSLEASERFLWDMRMTSQELILENYAEYIKKRGAEHGFGLSIEPYDMNPTADLTLGAVADVPMSEFWTWGRGFPTTYSCFEATSIAHVMGRPVVGAESFTAGETYFTMYPWSMKNQGDWAFCMGINNFMYHTFVHKALGDEYRPGMTMGPRHGIHWDRGRTWWPLSDAYHKYVSRCSHILQQGVTVSDILYLTPEGAPHVFAPPEDAITAPTREEQRGAVGDKKGYGFDGCSPEILIARASVKDGRIVFPEASSYRLMMLPQMETMRPELLRKITALVKDGATVVGSPPKKSPSLVNYPACDNEVAKLAETLWGGMDVPEDITVRSYGKGKIYWGGALHSDKFKNKPGRTPLTASRWIWLHGQRIAIAKEGKAFFRKIITVKPGSKLKEAVAVAMADDAFVLYINGHKVSQTTEARKPDFIPITASIAEYLKPGANVVAVEALNKGAYAGFIAEIHLVYSDGATATTLSDQSWQSSKISTDGWMVKKENLNDWDQAADRGHYNTDPWWLTDPNNRDVVLFPSYAETAGLLADMGVKEDFTAEPAMVRYAHRRTSDRDIYFVSNRLDKELDATCRFRAAQGSPELWDPITGVVRGLPEFKCEAGMTTVPMRFAPHQSFFVVFPREQGSSVAVGSDKVNFPKAHAIKSMDGAWDVAFDPAWGGPAKIKFDKLEDWSKNANEGIKYYSGIATYTKPFEFSVVSGQKVYLDLGEVYDMARVRLNGKDLGVVWCAPWQVEISSTLENGSNKLEIEVANRWVNRLVGDQQPGNKDVRTVKWENGLLGGREYKAGRYTFTTANHRHRKLLPAGLVGPVEIKVTGERGKE